MPANPSRSIRLVPQPEPPTATTASSAVGAAANPPSALCDRPETGAPAPEDADLAPLLLTARQAAKLCGVSLATWYRLASAARTPAPVRLSPGCVRYRADELRGWIAAGCPDRRTWEALKKSR